MDKISQVREKYTVWIVKNLETLNFFIIIIFQLFH